VRLLSESPSGIRLARIPSMVEARHAHLLLRGLCSVYLRNFLLASR
jgi:hypothetical protein